MKIIVPIEPKTQNDIEFRKALEESGIFDSKQEITVDGKTCLSYSDELEVA